MRLAFLSFALAGLLFGEVAYAQGAGTGGSSGTAAPLLRRPRLLRPRRPRPQRRQRPQPRRPRATRCSAARTTAGSAPRARDRRRDVDADDLAHRSGAVEEGLARRHRPVAAAQRSAVRRADRDLAERGGGPDLQRLQLIRRMEVRVPRLHARADARVDRAALGGALRA